MSVITATEVDRKSRVEDTTMQGFHQIVALSQDMIQSCLWSLWTDEDKDDELAKFDAHLPDLDDVGMTARMSQPTVELFESVEYSDHPPILYFNLNFVSGKLDYYTGFGPKAIKSTCDVGKWKLAFKVDLSLDHLATVPEEIQKKVRVPGEYSVSQLLIDFGTPDLIQYDRSKSVTPGLKDFDKEYFLDKFMKEYLTSLKKSGKTVLGYAITVPVPKVANPRAPSFPPTLLKYQTMCYKPTSGERTGPMGLDMFMFLEMTGENPKFPDGPLRMSGSWVIPGVTATMAICKENFWDKYLFAHLKSFNGAVLNLANRLKVCVEKEEQLRANETFPWSTTGGARPSNDSLNWSIVSNGADFSWKGRFITNDLTVDTDFKTDVRWSTGSNQIKLNVHVHLEKQESSGGSSDPESRSVPITYVTHIYVDREITLALNSVLDGGLEVYVQEDAPKVRAEGHKNWLFFDLSSGQVPERMKKHVEARMVNESLAEGIKQALNGQQNFVFPGGGTFIMRDPVFNKEGDLLIGLNYKLGQL
jgi:hypothetical protein